jgi:hypothetical protein
MREDYVSHCTEIIKILYEIIIFGSSVNIVASDKILIVGGV